MHTVKKFENIILNNVTEKRGKMLPHIAENYLELCQYILVR